MASHEEGSRFGSPRGSRASSEIERGSSQGRNIRIRSDWILNTCQSEFLFCFISIHISERIEHSKCAVGEHSEELPVGWATAKDSNGRIYYWHKETKATQWNKPIS